jgi:hypothetical protein
VKKAYRHAAGRDEQPYRRRARPLPGDEYGATRQEESNDIMDGELPTLIVPVRSTGSATVLSVVTGVRPASGRVGIVFTNVERLVAAMGTDQAHITLSEQALRTMLRPLGINDVERDPVMVGPRVSVPPRSGTDRRLASVGAGS